MIATIVRVLFQAISFIVLIDVLLSYFMSPFHPFKKALDSIVNPLLEPIRRIVPPIQNIDFSPVILLITIQIIETIILRVI